MALPRAGPSSAFAAGAISVACRSRRTDVSFFSRPEEDTLSGMLVVRGVDESSGLLRYCYRDWRGRHCGWDQM